MDEERSLCADLRGKCLGLSSLERTIARQRACVRNLANGDANTKYFHLLARGRRQRNIITHLKVGDDTITSQEALEDAVVHHFAGVFGQPAILGDQLDLQALGIVAADLSALDLVFSMDEVWAAIKEMPLDRTPGPGGYTGHSTKLPGPSYSRTSWQASTLSCSGTTDSSIT